MHQLSIQRHIVFLLDRDIYIFLGYSLFLIKVMLSKRFFIYNIFIYGWIYALPHFLSEMQILPSIDSNPIKTDQCKSTQSYLRAQLLWSAAEPIWFFAAFLTSNTISFYFLRNRFLHLLWNHFLQKKHNHWCSKI